MIRTGIFGGSFNPIHKGHVSLGRQLLQLAGLDEVWFVVSPQNPLKQQSGLLDNALRLRMVQLALAGEKQLVASDYEFGMPRPSYMWHTLQHMSADYPDRAFTLLIGADNWACFDRWYAYQEILDHYAVCVYPRSGSPVDPSCFPSHVRMVDTQLINISSTMVRQRIAHRQPIGDLVPPAVERFIRQHRLYEP